MTLILISGALAGLIHVLSGPDHLTAVAPIALTDGRRGWFAGWMWGVGHAAGVLGIATVAVILRNWLPPIDVLSQWGERAVGVALIVVGLWALRRATGLKARAHTHGQIAHDHLHVQHGPTWLRRLGHAHASFYLGILHGVAGSSHFFGVIPALALPSRTAAFTYLAAFGLGTIGAMTLFAAVVSLAGVRLGTTAFSQRGLMLTSSIAAFGVGAFWLLA